MVDVIPFPQGDAKPYNVKTKLFKMLVESKLPKVIIDLFTDATVKGTNPINTQQWNINSFIVNDEDPESGGIGVTTNFREVHTPLFLIENDIDYLGIKYFPRDDDEKLQSTNGMSLAVLLTSYMNFIPPIASDGLLFVVNLLDAVEVMPDVTIHGFRVEDEFFAVKFSHSSMQHQHYGVVFRPLPLVLDTLANLPHFKTETP